MYSFVTEILHYFCARCSMLMLAFSRRSIMHCCMLLLIQPSIGWATNESELSCVEPWQPNPLPRTQFQPTQQQSSARWINSANISRLCTQLDKYRLIQTHYICVLLKRAIEYSHSARHARFWARPHDPQLIGYHFYESFVVTHLRTRLGAKAAKSSTEIEKSKLTNVHTGTACDKKRIRSQCALSVTWRRRAAAICWVPPLILECTAPSCCVLTKISPPSNWFNAIASACIPTQPHISDRFFSPLESKGREGMPQKSDRKFYKGSLATIVQVKHRELGNHCTGET